LYLPLNYDYAASAAPSAPSVRSLVTYSPESTTAKHTETLPLMLPLDVSDDRHDIELGDSVMLIIEDDPKFSSILMDLAHECGFRAIVSATGGAALALVRRFKPAVITLDIKLPDTDGWQILDVLKRDFATRHIPVHIVSVEDPRDRGTRMGAFSVLEKPVDRETLLGALRRSEEFVGRTTKRLLLVEDDDLQANEIVRTIGNEDVETVRVRTGQEALAKLREGSFDCVVLDLRLPDMDGVQLIEALPKDPNERIPVIIHTAMDLTPAEEAKLRNQADAFILKGPDSAALVLDETALFLHRSVERLPPEKRRLLEGVRRHEPGLAGRKVLIVDDDIRNIFSLTGVLEQHGVQVLQAENGRDGIELLEASPDIDMVLMDVMMPDMDGYETMRQIRARERFRTLPMIAITAKAMKGDREKCIDAGASEYISKPVDVDQLVSTMRVWLRRG
jgi:CheY-like chemotaxis protein